MGRIKIWTDEQVSYLLENYQTMKYCDIAKHLGTNSNRVKKKLQALGLFKDYTPKEWTPEELKELYKVVMTERGCVLAKKYNCRYSEIMKHKRRVEKELAKAERGKVVEEVKTNRPPTKYSNPDYTNLIDYYAGININ